MYLSDKYLLHFEHIDDSLSLLRIGLTEAVDGSSAVTDNNSVMLTDDIATRRPTSSVRQFEICYTSEPVQTVDANCGSEGLSNYCMR